MTLPEFETEKVLRALDPGADVRSVASIPWREWVAGLSERRALGYASILVTEFRSTPALRSELSGSDILIQHLLWIRNRVAAWFEGNQQAWLTYLAGCAGASADGGGPWYWTSAHQQAWNDERLGPCPPPVKAMTLFGSSIDELVRGVFVPAARQLFTGLASMSASSRDGRRIVALVEFLSGQLRRPESEILADAWSAFADLRARMKLLPGDPERALESVRELKESLPEELLLRNHIWLQILHRALQMCSVPRRRSEPEPVDEWSPGPWFEEAFLNNWD